jgi:hypothetical protein
MRLGAATALLAIVGATTVGVASPAAAQTTAPTAPSGTWSPDLASGEAAGVTLDVGTVRLDPAGAFLAPAEDGATEGKPVPTGLLTLQPHQLASATDRVVATVAGDVPAGSTASVDVRGLRDNGAWTEWIPATAGPDGPTAALPQPASQVQGRLVLTGPPGAGPTVDAVTLTALPAMARRLSEVGKEQVPLNYRVFATREGLVGGTTANGHVIAERDHFVALPSRRALSPRGTSDYSVKVCAPNGRCAFAPVWDVGPWNTRDDYWNPGPQRQEWADLPQGTPQAQAAHGNGYNGGKDQFARKVLNPAGIDLGDGLFWDALGLKNNAWVTVDYLWTGSVRLSKVTAEGPLHAAPDAAAAVVGIAASMAAVPVECVLGTGAERWLRIGVDQYLPAASVTSPGPVGACETETETGTGTETAAAENATENAAAPAGDVPGAAALPEDALAVVDTATGLLAGDRAVRDEQADQDEQVAATAGTTGDDTGEDADTSAAAEPPTADADADADGTDSTVEDAG